MSDTTESASLTVCDTSFTGPEMPWLVVCCSEYGPAQPLKSLNIDENLNDTTESTSLTACDTSITEHQMPELMACCSEYGPVLLLKSLNIDGNLNMINQNNVLIQTPLAVFTDDDGLRTRQREDLFAFVCEKADGKLSRGFSDQTYDILKMLPTNTQVWLCQLSTLCFSNG